MLNRRFIRVKVFQALYAFFQTENSNLIDVEKDMFKSLQRISDLYLYLSLLLIDILEAARTQIETKRNKILPTEEDLNPNTKFVDNAVLKILEENHQLKQLLEAKRIRWTGETENIRKLWRSIQQSEVFQNYMQNETRSFDEDKKLIQHIFIAHVLEYDLTATFLEEMNMHWVTDMEIAGFALNRELVALKENQSPLKEFVPPLFKDAEDDSKFARELFRKTAMFSEDYQSLIATKTANWEVERLALIDVMLIKMAMTEFEHFSGIPPKVTMNEYIELAKSFSTPKSKMFVNGLLDKILVDMKNLKRINKAGRGLLDGK